MATKSVDQLDMRQIEKRLAAVLEKERRDAIGYAVLTVLCTPFFVVLISIVVMVILFFILERVNYDIGAKGFYTCTSMFLGSMAVFVLRGSNPPENPHEFEFDVSWTVGVGALLLLLYATYATSFLEKTPVAFAIVYTVIGILILAFFGRAYMKIPITQHAGREDVNRSLTLEIFGFVAIAYGEIASGSWLWIPPNEDEIRVAAWVLCKLALEDKWSLDSRSADKPILNLLFRLKYIQIKDGRLQLTYRGHDFITAADSDDYAVE